MNRLVSAQWDTDRYGNQVLRFRKSRGKLTLAEIEEHILYADHGILQNRYAIMLNAQESACWGSGWMDEIIQKEDIVDLYPLESEAACPVCNFMLPISNYCPQCGARLNAIQKAGEDQSQVHQ